MKYLKVWTNFEEVISPLTDAEAGRLFRLMLRYAKDGEEPEQFAGNEIFLWPVAKRDIDSTAEYNEIMRKNGLKGGRPKSKNNQIKAEKTENNQAEPEITLKEKKRKENKVNEKKGNENIVPLTRFMPPTVDDVALYCAERRNHVSAQKFVDYYSSNGWKVGRNPMKDWKAAVRTWERSEITEKEYQSELEYSDLPY